MIVTGWTMDIPAITLLEMFRRTAEKHPDHLATVFLEESLTYGELYRRTLRTMAKLQALGVEPGDRVGIMLPNCPEYVIAYFAITGLGAIVVQVNPMSTASELTFLLEDSGAQLMVAHDSLLPTVQQVRAHKPLKAVIGVRFTPNSVNGGQGAMDLQQVRPDMWMDAWFTATSTPDVPEADTPEVDTPEVHASEVDAPEVHAPEVDAQEVTVPSVDIGSVAVLQYTGGTTGRPKGAMLTHANLVANAYQSSTMIPGGVLSDDKMVCALPLFHVYAMTVCMNLSVLTGMTMLILPRFEPKSIISLFQQHKPTLFPAVPTMYVALSQFVPKGLNLLSCLRVCNSGGAPLPEQVMVHFEHLTGAVVLEGYGLSEASPVTHSNPGPDRRKPGSIGLPLANTEARIVDAIDGETELDADEVGELLIRGPQVMKGYWHQPGETARTVVNGWLHTGDIAKIDADGYAYIVDRKKDLIIASGFNVYPREVEEVLFKHPDVLEAAVVGIPDEYRGESVQAYVVLKPASTVTEAEMLDWCRRHLSAYKAPRGVEFRDALPKSAVGKVLRRDLRSDDKH